MRRVRFIKRTTIALSFLIGGTLVFAQETLPEPITLPLLDDDVSLRVPVRMFGQTNYFLVDTGTSATALDVRYRDLLGARVRQWDGRDFYRCPQIAVGNTRLPVNEVFCTDLKMLRMITGESCDGILGMAFLKRHVVQLDFDQLVLKIGNEVSSQMHTSVWRIHMSPSNQSHFQIPVVINKCKTLELLLDLGDSSTISLKKADWETVFPPGARAPVHQVLLAGPEKKVTQSMSARLASFEIESHDYSNIVCALSAYETAPSALGLGFFRKHEVVFDFPRQTLYLRPGSRFAALEEEDMSGMHLLREDGNTLVHSVDDGSPAANAGVKSGDRIISVNGQTCATTKMKTIRQTLRSKPGEKVILELKREEARSKVEFLLRRMI